MGNDSNISDINEFLEKAKKLITDGEYSFIPRRKNMQDLAKYGLTITAAKDEIVDLDVEDYYKGPKKDLDPSRPGDIWEFKKDIGGIIFYVKLKIDNENNQEILKCIGFHKDDFS